MRVQPLLVTGLLIFAGFQSSGASLPTPRRTDQGHVRFVVTGDDRWNTNSPRQGLDENGVNVTGLGRITAAVIAEKPDVLLFNGDLVGGGATDAEEQSQFDTWIKVMTPVYDAGIKVLTVRGNHEMHAPDAAQVWRKAMSGPRQNPGTSPAGEEDLTYSYDFGNCTFIALDEFVGHEPEINQPWLDSVLHGAHQPHVFAFAHKMAFFSGNHVDGMWTIPNARDKMIDSLADAGAKVVFFGHDHLYDHAAITKSTWPKGKSIHQIVIGTAGAPFVHGKTLTTSEGEWQITRIKHVEDQLGYAVVDVNGDKVTVQYKSEVRPGDFKVVDTWSYSYHGIGK